MPKINNKDFLKENEYFSKVFSPELYLSETSCPIRFIENLRIKKIVDILNIKSEDKILEIGCGAGDILLCVKKYISKHKYLNTEIYGVDASKYMITRCLERLPSSVELRESMAEELPFELEKFNKIICSEVLEHVADIDSAISEIYRVLSPQGRFVITYPNEDLINLIKKIITVFKLKKIFFPGKYQPEPDMTDHWHKRKIDKNMITEKLNKSGLTISRFFKFPCFLPVKNIVYGTKN